MPREFTGIPASAPAFFDALAADNTRKFWAAHKATYDRDVKAPFTALLADLAEEFGPASLFRPYRDTRFSVAKSPYKTSAAGFAAAAPGIGWYVELSAAGLTIGGGFHVHDGQQLDRYRQAVAVDDSGRSLAGIVADLRRHDLAIEGERLKTRPRGVPADHPRLDLLRHKDLTAVRRAGLPDWLATPRAAHEVRQTWRLVTPLVDWVMTYVGPA